LEPKLKRNQFGWFLFDPCGFLKGSIGLCAVRHNSSKFPQQINKAVEQEIISQNTIEPEISEMEASMELCALAICCKTGGQLGCIKNLHLL
jgi:hypothetical protein